MGSVNTMLSLAALMFFSLSTLNFNTAWLDNMTVELENKVILTAISLGDDMIEEIKARAFDEETLDFPTERAALTDSSAFGPDAGETRPVFDDVDDFHDFTRFITAPHAEDYYVSCIVEYVDEDDPDIVSGTQTYSKRATVTVTSPYMTEEVNVSFIFTMK